MLPLRHARKLASRLGPGLITGAADDDPSGLAAYSQAGAQFGAGLLWPLVWSAVVNGVIAVPIMAAMMWLGSRPEVLGDFTLSLRHRILGRIATAVMGDAVVAMIVAS